MKKSENLISKILSMVEANEPWIGIDTHDTTKLYDRKIFTPRNKSGARSEALYLSYPHSLSIPFGLLIFA